MKCCSFCFLKFCSPQDKFCAISYSYHVKSVQYKIDCNICHVIIRAIAMKGLKLCMQKKSLPGSEPLRTLSMLDSHDNHYTIKACNRGNLLYVYLQSIITICTQWTIVLKDIVRNYTNTEPSAYDFKAIMFTLVLLKLFIHKFLLVRCLCSVVVIKWA